jgi:hypothetical protein
MLRVATSLSERYVSLAMAGMSPTKAQRFYLRLIQNTPMTTAAAQSYFPNVLTGYWSSGVIDYFAAYTKITQTPFAV